MNLIDLPPLSRMIHLKSSVQGGPSFFRVGDVLEGSVVQQVDNHHVMIQITGHDFLAESHLPLCLNMKGHFRVEATDPQVILKLIPETESENFPIASWAARYLADAPSLENLSKALQSLWAMESGAIPSSVRATAEALHALVDRFSLQAPFSLDADDLQEFMGRSGLFFEHQLGQLIENHEGDRLDQVVMKDLKGLALRLRGELESFLAAGYDAEKHPATLKEIVSGLDQLLHKIEGYQILNFHASDPQGKLFLLLPLWFQNHLQFVEMNIFPPPSGPDLSDSEGISIFFLLHMPEWGKVSIEARVRGKGLYCLFKVTEPGIATFLSQAFSDLERALMRIGLNVQLDVSVEEEGKLPRSFLSEEMEKQSLLDIVI